MRQRALVCLLLGCAGCDANVVDAVREPAPLVTPEPPEPPSLLATSLLHRYGFAGEGMVALDSKGAAHGAVVGTSLLGDGQLSLAGGGAGEFVDLPSGMISGLSAATFEVWLTWSGGPRWQRLFDFGSSSGGAGLPGPTGTSYLFLTTESGDDVARALPGGLRAAYSENGVDDEEICQGPAPLPTGVATHVALVIDPSAETMTLYQDGQLLRACALRRPLSSIDDGNSWLGRSNYVADADFAGSFDEFRMYGAALSDEDIAASFAAGPDAKP
jgi:hypothetical protein